jgi:hypothetical protein
VAYQKPREVYRLSNMVRWKMGLPEFGLEHAEVVNAMGIDSVGVIEAGLRLALTPRFSRPQDL